MSRHKNSIEKTTFTDLPFPQNLLASTLGEAALKAFMTPVPKAKAGNVYGIAQWFYYLADLEKRCPEMNDKARRENATKLWGHRGDELVYLLMLDAAGNRDGSKLRLLADAIEATGPTMPHDPLRTILLAMNENSPKSAKQIVDAIKKTQPTKAPNIKTVHRAAIKLGVNLAPGKRGPDKGHRQKAVHRARQ